MRSRGRFTVTAATGVLLLAVAFVPLHEGGTGPPDQLGTAPVAASVQQKNSRLDAEIADLREQLEGTAADLVEAAVTLKRSQAQLVGARTALSAARAALAAAKARDQELAARIALARAEEAKTGQELQGRREQEAATRSVLAGIAREAYLTSGVSNLAVLAVFLDADNPQQLTDRMAMAGTAMRVQDEAIGRLRVQQSEIRARQAKLAAVRAEVTGLKQQSEAQLAQRQAAQRAATGAEAAVTALVGQQQRALAVIQARKAAELQRQAALEAEQARTEAMLRERARRAAQAQRRHPDSGRSNGGSSGRSSGGGDQTGRAGGLLARPAAGPITSGFGMRYHPIFHVYKLHTGTDFGIPCGTPVHAARGGVIVSAGWRGAYGNSVIIDHGIVNGVSLATTYNHLSRIVTHSGPVSTGELIGYSGSTGASTGCHLHFEVLVNGSFVDPMRWL